MPRFSPPSTKDALLTTAPWALALAFALAAHSGWFCLGHNHGTARVEIVTANDGQVAVVDVSGVVESDVSIIKRDPMPKRVRRLKKQVTRVAETHTVPAKLVELLYADPSLLARSGSFYPVTVDGTPKGFRVQETVRNGIVRRLGLRDGDLITKVDGEPLRTIDDVVEAAQAVREASKVTITIVRQRVTIRKRYIIE